MQNNFKVDDSSHEKPSQTNSYKREKREQRNKVEEVDPESDSDSSGTTLSYQTFPLRLKK